jgi:Mycoplasma protein of unknown function, DUF285
MAMMFLRAATFNQDLRSWDVSSVFWYRYVFGERSRQQFGLLPTEWHYVIDRNYVFSDEDEDDDEIRCVH